MAEIVRLCVAGYGISATRHGEELWLTASQVAEVLGAKHSSNVMKIYRRNAREFSGLAQEVVMDSAASVAGAVRVTCFSPRALYHFACLARTPRARAFRLALSKRLDSMAKRRMLEGDRVYSSAEDLILDAVQQAKGLLHAAPKGDPRDAVAGLVESLEQQLTIFDVLAQGGAKAVGRSLGIEVRPQRRDV